jgi:hypothetical protein
MGSIRRQGGAMPATKAKRLRAIFFVPLLSGILTIQVSHKLILQMIFHRF